MLSSFRRAGTLVGALVSALAFPPIAAAADLGFTVATWSFAARDYGEAGLSPGLYAKAGSLVGLAPRLELELYGVAEAAPSPFRDCFIGAEASLPIAGSRLKSYFNAFLSLGFLQAYDSYEGRIGSSYVSLRLTPLAIGRPYFGRRDRLFSIGALYELGDGSIAFVWSLLACDFFAGADKAQSSP
jgi:hypothetical protein